MEGALIEEHAEVLAGSVVHPGRRIPAGQVWGGNPAVYVRDVTKGELAGAQGHAEEVAATAGEHAYEFLPANTAYQQVRGSRSTASRDPTSEAVELTTSPCHSNTLDVLSLYADVLSS